MQYEYAEGMVRLAMVLFPNEQFEVRTDAKTNESFILHTYPNSDNGEPRISRYDHHYQMQEGCNLSLGIILEKEATALHLDYGKICAECQKVTKPQNVIVIADKINAITM